MRPVLYALSFILVMGLAFWAYRENYATQHQLKEIGRLQDEIATLRDALTLQRAEWAYLNRPERLRALTTANFDRLGLLPLEAGQFGAAAEVTYPVRAEDLATMGAVDPSALGEGQDGGDPAAPAIEAPSKDAEFP